jgi:hypothetical protein
MPVKCAVVIPTRNRSDLARNAIRSALDCAGADLTVLVSDNSTDANHTRALGEHCANVGDSRLRYVRPPEPLAMPKHWEFAVDTAARDTGATHFVILTDRMVFRAGMLRDVLNKVAERPDVVLSYNDDMVHDREAPVRLERKPLTGRVFDLVPQQLLYLSSVGVFPQALPRMLNCVVPRAVLDGVRARFGDAYLSVAPDLCFAYRCLAGADVLRYYDAPVMVQYGFARSNGTGYYGKTANDAWADFNRNAGASGLAPATPVPDVNCNLNVVYNEYCFVRQQANDPARFPEIDWTRYVHLIATDIQMCGNPAERERLFGLLRAKVGADLCGWAPAAEAPPVPASGRGVLSALGRAVRAALGFRDGDPTFRTADAAVAYSSRTPPRYVPIADHVQYMQAGWKLAG